MPRPGATPQPEFEGLAYGENVAANQLATDADVDAELFGDGTEDEDDFQPADEDEEFLFGPTDRPDEPLTAGVGFGPGIDATRHAFASDSDMLDRLAEKISANAATDPAARAWAAQRAKGL